MNTNKFKQLIEFNELSYQPKSHFVKLKIYSKGNKIT